MSDHKADNQRLIKNTLMLYIRTAITIVVALYTSRVVLNLLGADDYGIYNIVGGVVILFSFINYAMTSATQRFLSFALGRNDHHELQRVFSMSVTAHLTIALIFVVCAESVGLWLLNRELNIPPSRVVAAQWVYQFAVAATCFKIVRVPYHAIIIAFERMNFYAYISIVESLLNLGVVYLLLLSGSDRLILYGALTLAVAVVTTLCYTIYSRLNFRQSRYTLFWDRALYGKLMSFSGWSLLGSAANAGASQGINIVLNIFYGVTINAAMGIAMQVHTAINSFLGSFQTAFNPQIVKAHAMGESRYFTDLILQTSRLSLYLSLLMALPLIIYTEPILNIWLENTPQYSVVFVRAMMLFLLLDALSGPLWISIQAVGKIKRYQIVMAIIISLNIPIAYILLKCGASPKWVLFTRVAINAVALFARAILLRMEVQIPLKRYFVEVVGHSVLLALLATPLPLLCYHFIQGGVLTTLLSITLATLSIGAVIYLVGLNNDEKKMIKSKFGLK